MADDTTKTNARAPALSPPESTKVTVNLPPEAIAALREMAARRNTTLTDVLRTAIGTEKFLSDKDDLGAKILIEEKDRSVKQLVFSHRLSSTK